MSDQELATKEQAVETAVEEVATPPAANETPPVEAEPPTTTDTPEEPSKQNEPPPVQAESPTPTDAPKESSEQNDSPEEEPPSILDLTPGQKMSGKVKNITDFGAFVDIGLPQDGLVHISELSKKKVEKVSDVVEVGQELEVWVKKVDQMRGRISLTLIKPIALRLRDIEEDSNLTGTVTRLESYGAFVDIGSERDGLVHISQITHEYINHPQDALSIGDEVNVKVLKVNKKKRQIDLSIKALVEPPSKEEKGEQVAEPIEEVIRENIQAEEAEEGSAPTAMAMAYAAMQNRIKSDPDQSDKAAESDKSNNKYKQEIDDIVSRTLASND